MKNEVEWLDDALSSKSIEQAMTHYRVQNKVMQATNGRIVASCPCSIEGKFLVPGLELGKILKRLPNDPSPKIQGDRLVLRSGKFSGSLQILPAEEWRFPELETETEWVKFPPSLVPIMRDLRPFVSQNAIHQWSRGLAIDDGWVYATDGSALAGAEFDLGRGIQALIPEWVVDFILERLDGLEYWGGTSSYMAFKWRNGSWMRSTLIEGKFPERAGQMVRQVPVCTQAVSEDYRRAMARVLELSEEVVSVYADRLEGRTARTIVTEDITSEVPDGAAASLWGVRHLVPVMAVANSWSPSLWPAPVPFRGARVRGYIAGRIG